MQIKYLLNTDSFFNPSHFNLILVVSATVFKKKLIYNVCEEIAFENTHWWVVAIMFLVVARAFIL